MRIGVDLGGSNLRVAAFDDAGTAVPVAEHREPVGEPRDPDAIVERVARAIEQLGSGGTVGVGIAAMLRDRSGHVANSPHLRWRDVPFGELLARRLGEAFSLDVYNDASAIVWGEHVAGAARGCRDVLGVYVGTGIGGGVIANGALVAGTTACAGEIGHVKVRWDDDAAPCACGQRGCVEAYVGGSYVHRRIIEELARGARSSALALAGGLPHVHPGHVDAAAAEGDAWALALWTELAPLLAVALAGALAVLNPERLVLGGGLLARCPTLFQLVATSLEVATPAASLAPLSIALAELGELAGPCGAAHLAASARA